VAPRCGVIGCSFGSKLDPLQLRIDRGRQYADRGQAMGAKQPYPSRARGYGAFSHPFHRCTSGLRKSARAFSDAGGIYAKRGCHEWTVAEVSPIEGERRALLGPDLVHPRLGAASGRCTVHPAGERTTAHMQGGSVALSADGDTAIIGAPLRPTTPAPEVGAAFVFTRIGSTWSEQAKLVGTDYVQCSVCSVAQGWSVALSADGNTAIVGGPDDNNNIGAAWVFARSGSTWSQQGSKLLASDAAPPTGLGSSVALSADGNTAVIGGWLDNNETGAIWVFTRSGGVWSQQGLKLVGSNAVGAALQGFSVALSGDGTTAIVGGRYDNSNAGASWVAPEEVRCGPSKAIIW
jgi:hypothetical protein